MAGQRAPKGRLEGRIALVTGASRGIGAAVAERFAAEGARLILVARTVGGLEETDDRVRAKGSSATLVPMDLCQGELIDRLGGAVAERWRRLDVLVGNAAMLGRLGPLAHMPPELWEQVIRLNLTANWRLIRSFDPLLRASDAGRAIFVTSGLTASPLAYWGAYTVSKAGLEAMVRTYAAETRKTRVRVNLLDPGVVRTGLRAEAMPGENAAELRPPESVTEAFVALAEPACQRSGEVVRVR